MDIWEANKMATAFTAHPCSVTGNLRCEGRDCGDNETGERHLGVCDKDGCDFNPYRNGVKDFYGEGSQYKIDTSRPFTVVTQFVTKDGTDSGDLKEIKRYWIQDGRRIDTPNSTLPGLPPFNSLSDETCAVQKNLFGDVNAFADKGGMKAMGDALDRGMVLVMSIWDDHDANMLWLDADYPLDKDPNTPGIHRGPCSRDSGKPEDVES